MQNYSEDCREIGIIIDTETTGLDRRVARICQIAGIRVEGRQELPGFQYAEEGIKRTTLFATLLHPGVPIPAECTEIHGISDKNVEDSPPAQQGLEFLRDQIYKLYNCVEPVHIYTLGYNSERFDMPLIEERCRQLSITEPDVWAFRHIDLFPLVQRLDPAGRHKLAQVWEDMMGRAAENAHDAVADCQMTADILDSIMVHGEYSSLAELWAWAQTPTAWEFMPFGKHKAMPMGDVPTGYLRWLRENTTPEDASRDLVATLDKYLGPEK